MRDHTIREYAQEVEELFHRLENEHPEWLESLGATDDLEAFRWELTMMGYTQELKYLRDASSSVGGLRGE